MMAERGLTLAHTTIRRWVRRSIPEVENRWRASGRLVGSSWSVDATSIRVRSRWMDRYRAVDNRGLRLDVLVSEPRDIAPATRCVEKAVGHHPAPHTVPLDGEAASPRAVVEQWLVALGPRREYFRAASRENPHGGAPAGRSLPRFRTSALHPIGHAPCSLVLREASGASRPVRTGRLSAISKLRLRRGNRIGLR
jgi:hypothetical protein